MPNRDGDRIVRVGCEETERHDAPCICCEQKRDCVCEVVIGRVAEGAVEQRSRPQEKVDAPALEARESSNQRLQLRPFGIGEWSDWKQGRCVVDEIAESRCRYRDGSLVSKEEIGLVATTQEIEVKRRTVRMKWRT